ncbi:MAG: hypothetical protein V3V19_11430 [Cocleimonas sp.]
MILHIGIDDDYYQTKCDIHWKNINVGSGVVPLKLIDQPLSEGLKNIPKCGKCWQDGPVKNRGKINMESDTNMSRMKTLAEYNADKLKEQKQEMQLLDVLCDDCDSRLIGDKFILPSIPAKMPVKCSNPVCKFSGFMIV